MRALDRDHVAGLLDDAYQPAVATLVEADRAARALGEVEAHLAQRDLLLDVADRVRERVRVLGRGAQDVERQPLRRAVADAGELAQLGDQALERRREQLRSSHRLRRRAARLGAPPGMPPPSPPSMSSALIGSKPPAASAPPIAFCWSSSAERSASLSAAVTMSWSISTSSGSTASGSIWSVCTRMSPEMTTLTMPPPAVASTVSDLSFSCASCCWASIAWACSSILLRLGGWGIRWIPPRGAGPRRRTPRRSG